MAGQRNLMNTYEYLSMGGIFAKWTQHVLSPLSGRPRALAKHGLNINMACTTGLHHLDSTLPHVMPGQMQRNA